MLNKVLPDYFLDAGRRRGRPRAWPRIRPTIAAELPARGSASPATVERVLREIGESFPTTGSWRPARPSSAPSCPASPRWSWSVPVFDPTSATWPACSAWASRSGADRGIDTADCRHGQPRRARPVHTRLGPPEIDHLQRLVASWGLLADLCFADLMLFAAADSDDATAPDLVVLGQIRPVTSQTLYRSDLVGDRRRRPSERPLVARSLALGRDHRRRGHQPTAASEQVRVLCIPVRWHGRTVAVLTRESAPSVGRHPGELERTYVEVFNRFARMIAVGRVPVRQRGGPQRGGATRRRRRDPRSTARAGSHTPRRTPSRPCTASACTPTPRACAWASSACTRRRCAPRSPPARADTEEIERGPEITVLMRCIPLIERRPGHRRAWCSCATSPSCAGGTGCCCRRTRRSARSTTG